MDPFRFETRRFKPDTIVALVLGVIAAYLVQITFRFGGGHIFQTLIVVAAAGLWYRFRNVV